MATLETTNFNDTLPAAPANAQNNKWQADAPTADPRNVSQYTPVMVGDSGSGGLTGAVPHPAAGDAAAGKFLKADGTWAIPPGTGGGPVPVENEVVTFTGTSGTLANTPSVVSGFTQVKLYRDGQRLNPGGGNDFTWTGTAVTLASASAGSVFIADYWM